MERIDDSEDKSFMAKLFIRELIKLYAKQRRLISIDDRFMKKEKKHRKEFSATGIQDDKKDSL